MGRPKSLATRASAQAAKRQEAESIEDQQPANVDNGVTETDPGDRVSPESPASTPEQSSNAGIPAEIPRGPSPTPARLVPQELADRWPILEKYLVPLAVLGLSRLELPVARELEGRIAVKDSLRFASLYGGEELMRGVAAAMVESDRRRYLCVVQELAIPEIEAEIMVARENEETRRKAVQKADATRKTVSEHGSKLL